MALFTVVICGHIITNKASFSKIRVAYNDLYRKILHVSRRSSASAMFVNNNNPTFECLRRMFVSNPIFISLK